MDPVNALHFFALDNMVDGSAPLQWSTTALLANPLFCEMLLHTS